jgi:hypothetical protein
MESDLCRDEYASHQDESSVGVNQIFHIISKSVAVMEVYKIV